MPRRTCRDGYSKAKEHTRRSPHAWAHDPPPRVITSLEPTHVALTPDGPQLGGRYLALDPATPGGDQTVIDGRTVTPIVVAAPRAPAADFHTARAAGIASAGDLARAKRRARFPANRKGERAFRAAERHGR